MKYVIAAFLLITVVSCSNSSEEPAKQGEDKPSNSTVKMKIDSTWPSLPTTGFIKSRPATEQDIADGSAVFVAAGPNGKVIGQPIDIDIPQYAEWLDEKSGLSVRVIVVQAERANEQELIGYLNIETNEQGVALRREFRFLGVARPQR